MSNFNAPIVLYAATTNGYNGVESEYKNATKEMQEYESIFKRADEQFNETSAISQDYSPEIYEKYPNIKLIAIVGILAAIFALIFCVVRGLPVIIEASYLFEKK